MLIQKTPIIRNAEENRMKNGRASPVTVALLSIVLLSSFILLGLPPAKAQAPPPPPATLRITSLDALSNFIQDPNLTPGTSFVVDVNIDNVPAIQNSTYGGIQGFDITVNFDHTVLQPTGISHDAQRIPSCPSADTCLLDGKLTLLDQLCPPLTTCATGTARAVVTMSGSSNRFDTSSPPAAFNTGILFRIQFKVVGIGVTSIAVDTSSSQILGPLNSFPVPLPYTTVDASFDNTPPFGFSLSRWLQISRSVGEQRVRCPLTCQSLGFQQVPCQSSTLRLEPLTTVPPSILQQPLLLRAGSIWCIS